MKRTQYKRYVKVVEWDKPEWGNEEFSDKHILILTFISSIPIIGFLFWLFVIAPSAIKSRKVYYLSEINRGKQR